MPVKIFFCYAHKDEPLLNKLKTHLKPLQKEGFISTWHDRDISAGTEWEQEIKEQLSTADVILLLISPDFMASDYCYDIEMKRAIERHERREAKVIPIILRPVANWRRAPFSELQKLPKGAKPITKWKNQDEALAGVTNSICNVVNELRPHIEAIPMGSTSSKLETSPQIKPRINLPTLLSPGSATPPASSESLFEKRSLEKVSTGLGSQLNRPVQTSPQRVQKPPSFQKLKNKIMFFGISIVVALLVTLVSCGSYLYSMSFIENRAYCLSNWPSAMCPNGIGISSVTIDGNEYRIGIADEKEPTPFHPNDPSEADIEKLIFAENENAKQAKEHFTLILLTTLSTSPLDPSLSLSVGLEDLRGAYIAQHDFNKNRTDLKLRLLIGNLGTKNVASKTVSLVAPQVVLLTKNGGADNHILGVIGLPLSATALPVLPILHKYGVTVVSSSASTDELSTDANADPSEFHRVLPANSQQIPYIQQFILEVLHPANVLVISSNDSYSETLAEGLSQKLQGSNISFDKAPYEDGNISKNMPQILEKLQKTSFDLVVFTGFPNDLDTMLTQMKQQNIPLPKWIMGGEALYELGGYTNDNYAYPLIFTSFAFPDASEQYAKDYQAAYKDAFDPGNKHPGAYGFQRAGPHSALEYDAVLAYIQAVSNANGLDAGGVKQALQTVSFNGATGRTAFMQGSINPRNKTLYIVCVDQSGHTHAVWTYDPNLGGKNEKNEDMSVCNRTS